MMISWMWPQWTVLVFLVLEIVVNICVVFARDKDRMASVIFQAAVIWAIWMGGFWG